jgi:hypothetical protein
MAKRKKSAESPIGKYILWAAAAVFVGSILWSMWAETLLPLIRAGDTRAVWLHLVGLPIILGGTAVIVYGGIIFVRDTFRAFTDETLLQNYAAINAKQASWQMRWQNAMILFRAWVPGLRWLGLGFLLIAAGGFLINL